MKHITASSRAELYVKDLIYHSTYSDTLKFSVIIHHIWGPHGSEYKDSSLLWCDVMQSHRQLPQFLRNLLPLTSVWKEDEGNKFLLKSWYLSTRHHISNHNLVVSSIQKRWLWWSVLWQKGLSHNSSTNQHQSLLNGCFLLHL